MAGLRTGMAESTVRLLIAHAATLAREASTPRHHHPFWQLDHCASGTITVVLPSGNTVLRRGHGVLLPPGAEHAFRYRLGTRYVSWKFAWSGPGVDAVLLTTQPGWSGLAASLAAQPAGPAVPHLLTAALHLAGAPMPPTGLVAEVARLIEAHPEHAWSVAALARLLDLSPGHLSARFRSIAGMPLKPWIDARRAENAGRALAGSDLGIGEIAERCGFADQFAFSRFFRRVTGESPTAFRGRHG